MIPALAGMSRYNQFVNWGLTDDGRKVPVSPHTGKICSAVDPANWTDEATARLTGRPVAFVFADSDPYFFLDIDNCLSPDGTGWNQEAMQLLAYLPGAAVEVSQSGTGLHVFGVGVPPAHACNTPGRTDISLFENKRFVALTESGCIGDIDTDCGAGLRRLVSDWFAPKAVDPGAQWTTGPVGEYTPIPDEKIIKKAKDCQGAASILGGRASFADLWAGNEDALARSYPDSHGDRAFDCSSADMALAQHLAFWTGKDCERIKTLMLKSGLVRDKWDREDYLNRTILSAVALQRDVYTSGRALSSDAAEEAAVNGVVVREGLQIMSLHQQFEYFKGCCYVTDCNRIFTPGGALLDQGRFKARYGGYLFDMDSFADGKPSKDAWEVFTQSRGITFPKVDLMCFRPDLPAGQIVTIGKEQKLNTYVPADVPCEPGDVSLFLDHLGRLLPNGRDREILLSYMAAIVQCPGQKFKWSPVIQGVAGNGKSTLMEIVIQAVGQNYCHKPNPREVTGGDGSRFNSWLANKLFIGVEEIHVNGDEACVDSMKALITEETISIQAKGQDQYSGDNRANFIFCSNHKDAVLKNRTDRRFCIFFTAQQTVEDLDRCGLDEDYFSRLYEWLDNGGYANTTHYLRNLTISPEILKSLKYRAPETTSTSEAIATSMNAAELEILEAVESGRPGFRGGWISSIALDNLLAETRLEKRYPRRKRTELLKGLGYVHHPGLIEGRTNNGVAIDGGKKPRLFVTTGHPSCILTTASDITRTYEAAQGGNEDDQR